MLVLYLRSSLSCSKYWSILILYQIYQHIIIHLILIIIGVIVFPPIHHYVQQHHCKYYFILKLFSHKQTATPAGISPFDPPPRPSHPVPLRRQARHPRPLLRRSGRHRNPRPRRWPPLRHPRVKNAKCFFLHVFAFSNLISLFSFLYCSFSNSNDHSIPPFSNSHWWCLISSFFLSLFPQTFLISKS